MLLLEEIASEAILTGLDPDGAVGATAVRGIGGNAGRHRKRVQVFVSVRLNTSLG